MNPVKIARTVLLEEGRAVCSLAAGLDDSFEKAVELLLGCTGRAIVVGVGKSGLIARKIASTLASTGTPSIFVHPVECLHGDMGMILPRDVILALSYSGETEELGKLVPALRARGLRVIAMTGRVRSKLARLSDVVIPVKISKEACPYNITPTTSTTAMLALGDALAISLMRLRNFGKQDFAKLHPAGSLGRILTVKVKDIMHSGKANPVVRDTATVKEALLVMTKTRVGATSVTDVRGKMAGFFTDGDLRRCLQKNPSVISSPIASVMTRNPLTVAPDAMAADAALLLARKKIDNIPVVDKTGRPVGILDERDLLEFVPLE